MKNKIEHSSNNINEDSNNINNWLQQTREIWQEHGSGESLQSSLRFGITNIFMFYITEILSVKI